MARERFYKRIFLATESIPANDTVWKNLKVQDINASLIDNRLEFPTNLTSIIIINDDEDNPIEYSFNGKDLDGELFCDDGPLSQDCTSEGFIFFRLPEGSTLDAGEKVQVRVWAWRGGTGR